MHAAPYDLARPHPPAPARTRAHRPPLLLGRYIIPLFLYADHNRLAEPAPGYVLRHLGLDDDVMGAEALSRYAAKIVEERSTAV